MSISTILSGLILTVFYLYLKRPCNARSVRLIRFGIKKQAFYMWSLSRWPIGKRAGVSFAGFWFQTPARKEVNNQ